jgi:two-component system sensor histidine kinase UhpB
VAMFALAALALVLTSLNRSATTRVAEAVLVVVALIVIAALDLLVLRRVFRPLRDLTRVMRTVDPARPGTRLPTYSRDAEIVDLTDAFNGVLDRLESERRDSARRALAAQEDERRRLARELHDEIGQSLTGLLLHIEHVSIRAPADLEPALSEARELTRSSLDDVRRIARRLRPEALDELGLPSALITLTERVATPAGLRVDWTFERDLPDLSPEAELVIYRVAQESLTNVVRHARAHAATVSLARVPGGVVLRVADDGRGRNGAPEGTGMAGMRERATLVGARLAIGESAAGGVEVTLEVGEERSA